MDGTMQVIFTATGDYAEQIGRASVKVDPDLAFFKITVIVQRGYPSGDRMWLEVRHQYRMHDGTVASAHRTSKFDITAAELSRLSAGMLA